MSRIISYENGTVRSALVALEPTETEYQKGVREYFERQEREKQEAQAEKDKKAAAEKVVVQPDPAPVTYNMEDAARLIMAATADMKPAERGYFIELLSKRK